MGNYQTEPSKYDFSLDASVHIQNQPISGEFNLQEATDSLNVQELFTASMIPSARVNPKISVQPKPGKSQNFRPASAIPGMTPAFTGGFSFKPSKRNAVVFSMSEQGTMEQPQTNIDKIIMDAFPEAEREELLEEQRKQEVKAKALEKIKLEKELQEELEKQKILQEKEAAQLDDVDGFNLFNQDMNLPKLKDEPDYRNDLEDKVEEISKSQDEVIEQTNSTASPPVDSLVEEQCVTLPDGYVYCVGEDDLEDPDDEDEEEFEQDEKEQTKIWSIIYSKKPELIIDKDEYDRILIDLLQSYADFKQTTIKMDKLQKIE